MELSTILIVAAVLACPIAMGLMMWMMNKNMGGDSHQSTSSTDECTAKRVVNSPQNGKSLIQLEYV